MKGICRTVINAVHQSKCNNMEVRDTMRIAAMVFMLIILVGLFINAERQIYKWLSMIFQGLNRPVSGMVFGLLVLTILAVFVVSRIPGMGAYGTLFLIDHYALGFLAYVVIITNAVSLLLFALRLTHLIQFPVSRSVRLVSAALSMLLAVGLTVFGAVHAANIQIRRYHVRLGQEQAGMETIRLVLLSDIHLGYVIEEKHLAKIVSAVNALKPDIICIAGDIFDGDITSLANPGKLMGLFGKMESEYGVYACLGNHDAGDGYQPMLDFLDGAGVRVLMDEAVVIDRRFVLAGRRDSSPIGAHGDSRRKLEVLPDAGPLPVIVLDHQPGNLDEYGSETDLILCGHTHQGQMFPFNLITNAVFDVDYGYYRANATAPQVIVTSGAGTWGPPLRVATDNEIAEIDLLVPHLESEQE